MQKVKIFIADDTIALEAAINAYLVEMADNAKAVSSGKLMFIMHDIKYMPMTDNGLPQALVIWEFTFRISTDLHQFLAISQQFEKLQ